MRIFVIGASGNIGTRIRAEALSRGHRVTGLTRDASRLEPTEGLEVVEGNVGDVGALAAAMRGHDAVIVSHGNPPDDPLIGPKTIIDGVSILAALREAGLRRVVWVGGAGSLIAPDGRRVVDTMDLPGWANSAIWAMAALYMHLRTIEDLDWTFVCPSQGIAAGERTGRFRLGADDLLVAADGTSFISYEDFAIALVDEAETGAHPRQRITVGY